MFNPWHEVSAGKEAPSIVNGIIEIPKGSRAKYELDKETGMLKLDRVIFSAMHYPANYGFIPQTYCEDNDPLDILVLTQETLYPLTLVECKPIGVMRMLDNGEADDKIIAVAAHDISVAPYIHDVYDLREHFRRELHNFFEDYKKLEKRKTVRVEEFMDRDTAMEIIVQATVDYAAKFGAPTNK
jgi:inorganic pyrophosphatase